MDVNDTAAMHRAIDVLRWNGAGPRPDFDSIVVEEPLEIRVNDTSLAVTMRTPGQDEALAAGFLVTEGIVRASEDIFDITRCADPDTPDRRNIVNVYLDPARLTDCSSLRTQHYATSSCGICGRASIEAIRLHTEPVRSDIRLGRDVVCSLPDELRAGQRVFDHTGGLHAAGLFTATGQLLYVEEDVGRHNAVDKLIGRALLEGFGSLDATVMMVSGRAGFEIVQKAVVARIPVVCSVSAPSSLAVELAREMRMTLVGFLRGDKMNVYAGGHRISRE